MKGKIRLRRRQTCPQSSLAELVRAWEGNLARTGRSQRTAAKYLPVATRFADAFRARQAGSITAREADEFLQEWEDENFKARGKRPSRATQRNRVTALKSFYAFLDRYEHLLDARGKPVPNPMARLDTPPRERHRIDRLTPEEDQALLACDGKPHEIFIVALLRWTGIRVGEARAVRIRDVDLDNGQLLVPASKTATGVRTVPLAPEFVPLLKTWLRHLEDEGLLRPDGPLLPTRYGTPMQETFIWRVLKRMGERAGVRATGCTCDASNDYFHQSTCARTASGDNRSAISAHTLRRTYATDLCNRGLGLEHLSQLLGHANVSTTQESYAELLPATTKAEYLKTLGHKRVA